MDALSLLPSPRSLAPAAGHYTVTTSRLIVLQGAAPGELLMPARYLQAALAQHAGAGWELSASALGPAHETGIVLRVAPGKVAHDQGYELTITPEQITIEAQSPVGVLYGVYTLGQIVRQRGRQLPALHISDWPDFPVRGVMLDISRDKVPRMDTLYGLIDMLAGWKINQVQLYTEHTFAYRRHPDVWAKASPMTGDEVLALDRYCRERHVELVPNQNSFGHMQRWLVHDRYAPLAEVHGEFSVPWGTMSGPFSLCPGDPGSLELVRSLYDELLPHFSSKQFNVGCDETFDLGQGRSREECERRGVERVYLDFLHDIHREVAGRGYTMQFWGDIIVHRPELISELPKDSIALEWGYEADHPFDEHGARFAQSGIPFYVCPGTSSWNSIAGRTDNAVANLLSAAENGLKHGATGYLNTDWGDNGHWQALPVSYLGFAVGAAYSWALDANRDMDIALAVSAHAFHDPTGSMGRLAYDLGNVYRAPGVDLHNSSVLFWTLQRSFDELRKREGPVPDFAASLGAIERAMESLSSARMQRADAALIAREYENTARMLRHACRRGQLMLQLEGADAGTTRKALDEDLRDIIREYEDIWLLRNRPGGLADSVVALEKARADYETI
ncbi:MAG: family 20 glycosylhydrolase [Chloroflexota bacterium]|nr:family 20 glycosylhydrolase [Chloroflexota bacterium]MDQ5864440.1 family 20 glycosylhydrolase [Chloroflexota bacterium]